MKSLLFVPLSALALAACSKPADGTANDTAAVSETENSMAIDDMAENSSMAVLPAVSAPEYAGLAGAADLFEIESSKIVLETTKNPAVKSFAQMMIAQHTQSTETIKAAAKEAKLDLAPPSLSPPQQAMITDIEAASGTERDAIYVRDQAKAHRDALALHQGYASSGESAPLKKAASGIVPVVQKHLDELSRIDI